MAGVEVCVVDPESKQPLPAGSTGILLVRGPSVFRGDLEYDGPDPFLTVNGHRWYYTGDLVQLDDEGFIHFRGRLKRFLKAGGEMISLPALEEPLARLHPPTENGPQVAVEGIETPEGRWIVLFTTRDLALAPGERRSQRGRIPWSDASGRRRSSRRHSGPRHGQDRLQAPAGQVVERAQAAMPSK